MSEESKSFMVQMGFSEDIATAALAHSKDNLEAAINWALENKDKPVEEAPKKEKDNGAASQEAKSLKCEDCGKLFKNIEQAELHGLRTNHENFAECTEEVKPLSPEEKQQQQERIQKLIVERRTQRLKDEENTELEREKDRRAAGKNLSTIKQQMQEVEVKKAIEDRKREKQEDRMAKQRILEQIERDKQDRKLREQREKEGNVAQVEAPAPAKPAEIKRSNAAEARIQVRLSTGSQFSQTFASSEPLAAVRCLVMVKEPTLAEDASGISLMCPFQGRRVFTEEDMEVPLKELGLSPSAVLIAQKKT